MSRSYRRTSCDEGHALGIAPDHEFPCPWPGCSETCASLSIVENVRELELPAGHDNVPAANPPDALVDRYQAQPTSSGWGWVKVGAAVKPR